MDEQGNRMTGAPASTPTSRSERPASSVPRRPEGLSSGTPCHYADTESRAPWHPTLVPGSSTSSFGRLPRTNRTTFLLAMLLLVIPFAMAVGSILDNDMWFMLATGEEIVQNGFPYTNPFMFHLDCSIVIQQWIPCVALYLSYSLLGYMGIGILVLALFALLTFLTCRLAALYFTRGNRDVMLVVVAVLMGMLVSYISARPSEWSMLLIVGELYVLEKYRRTNDRRYLLLLPLISILHSNIHASMWVLCFAFAIPYLFKGLPRCLSSLYAFKRYDYDRRWLLVAIAAMAIVGLINPYGVSGVMYLVNSFGAADYRSQISEMSPIKIWSSYGFIIATLSVVCLYEIGHRRRAARIALSDILIFLGTAVVSCTYIRNYWFIVLGAMPLLFEAFGAVRLPRVFHLSGLELLRDGPIKRAVLVVVFMVLVVIFVGKPLSADGDYTPTDSSMTPVKAIEYLDAHGVDTSSAKIFNHFNSGGYLEWNGYLCFMDPRPELWNSGITGQLTDYYYEYVDATLGSITSSSIIDEYGFDYLIVDHNSNMEKALKVDSDYTVLVDASTYSLWGRTSTAS